MELLVDAYGAKIGATGERIVLSIPNVKEKKEYPIHRLEKIVILRPASLTTHAVKLALDHDVDIVYLGQFGKPFERFFSSEPKGLAEVRRAQLIVASSPGESLSLAKAFIRGKASNQECYIRYLGYHKKKDFSRELIQMQTMIESIDALPVGDKSKEQLLGIEGYVADRYFVCLKKLYRFPGRRPEGRDIFNSALNYAYGILYNEVERYCMYVGLDPYVGLYHSERYGKPSLVLDLVEEFRVPVVDSAVFPLFLAKSLKQKTCFEKIGDSEYQLSQEGKRLIIGAVLNRFNETTIWRGKRRVVKKVIEEQIRFLARYFVGRETSYRPFGLAKLKMYE